MSQSRSNARWISVALIGVVCGLLTGGVCAALTGSVVLGLVVGVPTAAILVVLGVTGSRQRAGADAARLAHEARLARQRRALDEARESRNRPEG